MPESSFNDVKNVILSDCSNSIKWFLKFSEYREFFSLPDNLIRDLIAFIDGRYGTLIGYGINQSRTKMMTNYITARNRIVAEKGLGLELLAQ